MSLYAKCPYCGNNVSYEVKECITEEPTMQVIRCHEYSPARKDHSYGCDSWFIVNTYIKIIIESIALTEQPTEKEW